jgi:hypothetical protein
VRLIRPAKTKSDRRGTLLLGLGMLLVAGLALLVMALLPTGRMTAAALLAIAAAMGIGVGAAMLLRAAGRGRIGEDGEDIARLLAPIFDDDYALILSPRLPGVRGLGAILVGPAGARALVARRWRGRYRVRGRGWEYDTRSRAGWIRCRTNPSFDADVISGAVVAWARTAADEPSLPIAPAVIFPLPVSRIVLEEPDTEVVTTDNAPWWAQSIGRVRRMDAARVARFVQSVIEAADTGEPRVAAPTARRA